jgi:hypothetical protein
MSSDSINTHQNHQSYPSTDQHRYANNVLGIRTAVLHWAGFRDGPPAGTDEVKSMVAQVKEAVQQLGPMTVIVSHCIGAYVAHKYLESWGASGVALVNPVPPDPRKTIDRWVGEQGIKGGLEGAEDQLGYKGLFASAVEAPRLTLAPEKLLNMDPSNPEVCVPLLCLGEDVLTTHE